MATNFHEIGDKTNLPEWLQTSLREVSKMHDNYLRDFGLNVRMPPYNIKGDGTDEGEILQEIFNLNVPKIYIPAGTYNTSIELVIPDNKIVEMSKQATIKATAPMTNLITVNTNTLRDGGFIGGVLDGNHLAENVFFAKNVRHYKIEKVLSKNGIEKDYKLGDTNETNSYEITMSGCFTSYSGTVPNNLVGLYIENCTDSYFIDIVITGAKIGVIDKGFNNHFVLVHTWNSVPHGGMNVSFEVNGKGTIFTNCYSDTPHQYGWVLNNESNTLEGCTVYNGDTSGGLNDVISAFYISANYRNNFLGCVVNAVPTTKILNTFKGSTTALNVIGMIETNVTNRFNSGGSQSFLKHSIVDWNNKKLDINPQKITTPDGFDISVYQDSAYAGEGISYRHETSSFSVSTDNKADLGRENFRWKNIYALIAYLGQLTTKNSVGKSITMNGTQINASDEFSIGVYQNYSGLRFYMGSTYFNPSIDNNVDLGLPSNRFKTIYAGTGAINTSDERHKQQINMIDDVVLDAWSEVNYSQYKFNDAVQEKGEEARWHIGVVAQEIERTFNNHGLSAFDYGIICYDEWNEVFDNEGNQIRSAGNIYSIRPNECLMLEAALQRRVTKRIESQLAILNNKLNNL